jgi:hypothetical protein
MAVCGCKADPRHAAPGRCRLTRHPVTRPHAPPLAQPRASAAACELPRAAARHTGLGRAHQRPTQAGRMAGAVPGPHIALPGHQLSHGPAWSSGAWREWVSMREVRSRVPETGVAVRTAIEAERGVTTLPNAWITQSYTQFTGTADARALPLATIATHYNCSKS